ncbi:MAG: hypothetical protein WCE73_12110 [Candidatus Angelobacter sp.]
MRDDLSNAFQLLWDSKDPIKRGHQFEDLFCRLLFKSRFRVQHDSATAKPRQTDILAEYGRDTFLFEIKGLGRKLDIDAVAQITDRLRRTSKNTIGCICSASGFTETLIKDIEACRPQHEILLFNPYEIYQLFNGLDIVDLIDQKRRVLRQDGLAWFYGQEGWNSKSRFVEMPPSHESLGLEDSSVPMRLESQHISDIIYVRTAPIFNEYLLAFSLRIRLRASSIKDLKELFFVAENHLGLQGTGAFGIRQQASGWYGLGSDNFLSEVARYAQRYKGYKDQIHHSEELAFFDELNSGGIFLLTARQSLTIKGQIHSGELIIRLPGIPADTEPYKELIRAVGKDDVLFTPEQPLQTRQTRLSPRIRIEIEDVITRIGSTELGEGCVSGVVVKNPFFRNPGKTSEVLKDKASLAFAEPEYLFCRLDHWLDTGDEVDYFILTGLETVSIGEAVLLHPRCTWGNLTKRSRPADPGGFRKMGSEWKRQKRLLERIKRRSKRNAK